MKIFNRCFVTFILHLLLFSVVVWPSFGQPRKAANFKVSLSLEGVSGQKILLGNKPASGTDQTFVVRYYDSCVPNSNLVQFELSIEEPIWYSIEVVGKKGWKSFVATPGGSLKIEGNIDSIYKSTIYGSEEDSVYQIMVNGIIRPLYTAMYKSSPDSFARIYPQIIRDAKYKFITENPGSFVVAKYLVEGNSYNLIKDTSELEYLRKCYLALSPAAKEFTCSKNAYYNLFVAVEKLSPGKKIPNLSFINYNGEPFDLYQYKKQQKKKYYFIDFWATWCAPCIEQFPALGAILDKFGDKGFCIIGYSLDTDETKYNQFLKTNSEVKWMSFSDFKGEESEAYKIFKLGTIPANFLFDENGVIIASNITPEKLSELLSEELEGW